MKKKVLLALAALGLLIGPIYAGQIPVAQVYKATAVWNFNELSGTIAFDEMGNVNGVVTGGVRSFVPGFGVGIRFSGTAGDGVITGDPLASLPANVPKTFIVAYRPYQITAGNQFLMSQNNGLNANTLSITHRTIGDGTIDIQAGMNPTLGTTLTLTASKLIRANQVVVIAVTASTIPVNGGAASLQGLAQGVNVWVNGQIMGSSITANWNGCSGSLGIGVNPTGILAEATGDIPFAAVLNGIPTKSQMKKMADDLLAQDDSYEQ